MSGTYKMGNAETFTSFSPCDKQIRTFKTENSAKLWKKLHCKKCKICQNAQVITTFTDADIDTHKGDTMNSYLNNFNKRYV
jgi:hypothetical protein